MAVMRRTTPEGGLGLGVTAEEARRCPEEFYAVVFKNPERRAVVARGREGVGVGGVNGDNADDAEDGGERSTFTCDQEAVREFMSAPAARFHRAAHTYVVAGDAFDAGDFRVRICRVETNSGAYVGTILDVTYNATSDAATARRALEEYAAYATAAAMRAPRATNNEATSSGSTFDRAALRTCTGRKPETCSARLATSTPCASSGDSQIFNDFKKKQKVREKNT